jgi:hypothetical protein
MAFSNAGNENETLFRNLLPTRECAAIFRGDLKRAKATNRSCSADLQVGSGWPEGQHDIGGGP